MRRGGKALTGIRKRSVGIRGHRTSISLEEPFFAELERLATSREISLSSLIAEIDTGRDPQTNLSSAIRLHILEALKTEAGR